MKYVIILGDGMADKPLEELQGKTPLEYAKTPNIDKLAQNSEIGLVNTIPNGMEAGSDVANLSVLGYNPVKYYTGRSPLEALSIGVDLKEDDVSLRCNLVTLEESESTFENKMILDHSAGEITTQEAEILLEAIKNTLETDKYKFYLGTSYRHLLVWHKGIANIKLTPPHDVLEEKIAKYLPIEDKNLLEMMKKSYEILNNHPINLERKKKGLNPANAIWFWGAGTRPKLDLFEKKYKVKGGMISAVDLLKGIATGANMKVVNVKGANGTLHTNYQGKVDAAINLLKNECDFVYVHVEAPDECGHQGNLENKIKSIEYLDEKVVYPLYKELEQMNEEYRILILPDHPTPIQLRTHTNDPVPYLIYEKNQLNNQYNLKYNEKDAKKSKNYIKDGYKLMEHFLNS